MLRIAKAAWMVCLGVGLAAGCGDDDDGGPNNAEADTGLPEATLLSELSEAEYVQGCERLKSTVGARLNPDTIIPPLCAAIIGAITDDPTACEDFVGGCIDDVNSGNNAMISREDLDFAGQISCEDDAAELDDCDVTVAELETCVNDTVEFFEGVLGGYTCANAASIDASDAQELTNIQDMAPPSCASVSAECPGLSFAAGGTEP